MRARAKEHVWTIFTTMDTLTNWVFKIQRTAKASSLKMSRLGGLRIQCKRSIDEIVEDKATS